MKRNLTITTAVAAALATSVAGCGQPSYDRGYSSAACVDKKTQKRVLDRYCSGGNRSGGYGMYYFSRGTAPRYGSTVRGGSYSRPAPVAKSYSSSISRGGFGSSAKSFGSFSSGS